MKGRYTLAFTIYTNCLIIKDEKKKNCNDNNTQ